MIYIYIYIGTLWLYLSNIKGELPLSNIVCTYIAEYKFTYILFKNNYKLIIINKI